jgi:hypothetical protein
MGNPSRQHLRRKVTATFLEAAVSYMEAGGETRFLGPLIDHFGTTRLDEIDRSAIDGVARLSTPAAHLLH